VCRQKTNKNTPGISNLNLKLKEEGKDHKETLKMLREIKNSLEKSRSKGKLWEEKMLLEAEKKLVS
jgi:hypothetical protein